MKTYKITHSINLEELHTVRKMPVLDQIYELSHGEIVAIHLKERAIVGEFILFYFNKEQSDGIQM